MKIIFLDIDGVLNSEAYFDSLPEGIAARRSGNRLKCLDKSAITRLNKILKVTGAEIVLSSSWRVKGLKTCNQLLTDAGCEKEAIGSTPMSMKLNRVNEIRLWREESQHNVVKWIAIDDEDISLLGENAVQTSSDRGLQDEHVREAIDKLL